MNTLPRRPIEMKYLLPFFLFLITLNCRSQIKEFTGYYVTQNGDTINGTVFYHDITQSQDTLQFRANGGEVLRLAPHDIRGFGIFLGNRDFELADGKTLTASQNWVGFKSEVNANYILGIAQTIQAGEVTRLDFESVYVDEHAQHFLRRENNDGQISYYTWYFTHIVHRKGLGYVYTLSSATLVGRKGVVVVRRKKENTRQWMSRVVSDYPMLSSMILQKQFSLGPALDIKLIVEEYNQHALTGRTVSPVLSGIDNANRLYSAKPIFLKTFAGTGMVLLPGLAISGYYLLQPLKPVWPKPCPYCNDEWYVRAYRLRARAKKQKAIDRGILYGFIVAAGVATALAAGD
jgi:hypothetical protein